MKASLALLMFVHILGGGRPEVVVVPYQAVDIDTCHEYVHTRDANQERSSNVFNSRPIISSYYTCTYIHKSLLKKLSGE